MNHKQMMRKLMKNKKGGVLMYISLLLIFALVAGFGTFYMFKTWKEANRTTLEPQLYIGERQINLLLTANQAEMDMFYLDQAAKYSASESFLELAEKGGRLTESDCGTYMDYAVVKDEEKFCELNEDIFNQFSQAMNKNFVYYAVKYSTEIPDDFEYEILEKENSLNILGVTENNIEYEIGRKIVKRDSFAKYSSECHYCVELVDKLSLRENSDYKCNNLCCKGPCPEEAIENGIPLVSYLNQCADSEVSDYEDDCRDGTRQCNSGCGPTAMNMVLEYYGISSDLWYFFNKETNNVCFKEDGYDDSELVTFARSKDLNAQLKKPSESVAWQELIASTRNGLVILHVAQTEDITTIDSGDLCQPNNLRQWPYCVGGHYFVVLYADDNYAIINDPFTGRAPKETGNNLVIEKDLLMQAWKKRDFKMISIESKNFDPTDNPYKELILSNNNLNWIKYYPVDSSYRTEPLITSLYGKRNIDISSEDFHYGVDISVPKGAYIYAIADGEVVKAGRNDFNQVSDDFDYEFNTLEIKHIGGYYTRYLHNSEILVQKGDLVRAGQTIARVGNEPEYRGFSPHLHIELFKYKNSEKVNYDILDYYYSVGEFTQPISFVNLNVLENQQPGVPESKKYYSYIQDHNQEISIN